MSAVLKEKNDLMAGVNAPVIKFLELGLVTEVDRKLQEVSEQYGITPLFAGLFGSQAKGYAGPDSDYDLYVVYHGQLIQYVKAITMETHQQRGEEALPPQITFEARGFTHLRTSLTAPASVQLNFVSLDDYAQELGRSNVDFRIALDNIVWSKDVDTSWYKTLNELLPLLGEFARASYDAEKTKHMGLGRAAKVIKALKANKEMNTSELTDALYRIFTSWSATRVDQLSNHVLNKTQTLKELMRMYLETESTNAFQVATLRNVMLPEIEYGEWLKNLDKWKGGILRVLENLTPVIEARPAVIPPPSLVDKSIEARLQMANQLNELFVRMLLKGGK